MSHLSLRNSLLFVGYDFRAHPGVEAILARPEAYPVVLFPGPRALDLSAGAPPGFPPPGKTLVVFVIDGTWSSSRKTLRVSENLARLPRICFRPAAPSRFRVRMQPRPECCSTIEAIHHTIELLGPQVDFPLGTRAHDSLLRVFDSLVDQQLRLAARE